MPAEDLLSKKKLHDLIYWETEYKRQYEDHEGKWRMYGKAYHGFHYRRLLHITKEEALCQYLKNATLMDMLEKEIEDIKRRVYLHFLAIEELNDSMDPFKGLDMRETTLVQKPLF